jgi:uncharacterized SAM-binding protein YcdF (DUF218 family)
MARAIVIFGAAIHSDGQPSPSLKRRAYFGALAARARPDDPIFCSGGVGRFGDSEASAIAQILRERGVDPGRVVLDEESKDTLQNVVAATRFIRAHGLEGALACTDSYHLPRVQMLFSILGIDCSSGLPTLGLNGTALNYWLAMRLRECAAYPYDLAVALWRRRELLRLTQP